MVLRRFGLPVLFATAAVLWRLAQPEPGLLGRGLQLRLVMWVGAISYEMYLWHWPLYLVITPTRTGLSGGAPRVRLASVVALAAVTHFFVGEPIRRGARLRSPQPGGVMTMAAVIVVGASVFLAPSAPAPLTATSASSPTAVAPRATAEAPVDAGSAPTGAPVKVLVVGDSQGATAQGLDAEPGAHGLSAQPGLEVWNRAILGCSITSAATFVIDGERVDNRCGATGAGRSSGRRRHVRS